MTISQNQHLSSFSEVREIYQNDLKWDAGP